MMKIYSSPFDLIYVHVAVGDGIDGQCRHAFQAELVHADSVAVLTAVTTTLGVTSCM